MENLTDIAVFVRVAERGRFTLAADDLTLSRAAVSKAGAPPKVRAFVDFLAQRFGRKPEWERY